MKSLSNAEDITLLPINTANTVIYSEAVCRKNKKQESASDSHMSTLQSTEDYATNHRIAKVVVCLVYILLGTISIETGNSYIALIVGTCIWFFGINAVGHLIESLKGHRHTHNWL